MKKIFGIVVVVILVLAFAGCTAGPNELKGTQWENAKEDEKAAGFWPGLWHGFIAPCTLIISLFSDKIHMYEVHNSGNWYNFGFLLGMMVILGGGGRGSAWKKSR